MSSRRRRRSTGSTTARRCARSRACCGRAVGSLSSGMPATSASRGWPQLSEDGSGRGRGARCGCAGRESGLFEAVAAGRSWAAYPGGRQGDSRELVLSRSYCAVLAHGGARAGASIASTGCSTQHELDGMVELPVPDRVLPRSAALGCRECPSCRCARSRTMTFHSSSSGRQTRRASGWRPWRRVTPTHLQRTGRGSGVTPGRPCGRSSRTVLSSGTP